MSPVYFVFPFLGKSHWEFTEISMRIPSIYTGVLTIPLFYYLVSELTVSKYLVLLAALFAALDNDLIFYSMEAKPYYVVILFIMISFYLFIRYIKSEKSS